MSSIFCCVTFVLRPNPGQTRATALLEHRQPPLNLCIVHARNPESNTITGVASLFSFLTIVHRTCCYIMWCASSTARGPLCFLLIGLCHEHLFFGIIAIGNSSGP